MASRPSSPRLGFPRAVRLVRRSEFEVVYKQGRRQASPSFVIFGRANGLDRSRFGLSVKLAQGGAVLRNRIRRRIREILRLHLQEIAPGWDIVIHPRSSIARAPFTNLATELVSLIRRFTARP